MYFDTKIRTRRTQPPRNDNGVDSNVSDRLSVFKCPERAFGYSSTRALEDRELVAAEIYIFMNCAELDPYIEVQEISYGPSKIVRAYLGYIVNGTWRTESEGFHLRRPRVCLPVHAGHLSDRDCLPVHVGRPGDRYMDRLPNHASSATFPFFLTTSVLNCFQQRWRTSIQQRMRRGLSYLDGSHVGFQGKLDHFKLTGEDGPRTHSRTSGCMERVPGVCLDLLFDMFTRYTFTRPEDLPRARAVWESTAQTNLRKSMYEARDKAMKTTGSRDPMAWLDYDPFWLRRDYWESLCHHWATGPWQERSQAEKRN
ncbi:hypothetical protein Taro_022988 [Colocasia esculenta]|uniref:Uncharacterized protein n=1 Tax=Colocasia esculenta TaxID=4460 RepID=A0A843VG17_COLES|nr:hypothetical protein [Colocasia esculenta]